MKTVPWFPWAAPPDGADVEGEYRYRLWRVVDPAKAGTVVWVMLNPSIADAVADDPTIRRCRTFTRLWGYGRMEVVNLFALRSPKPQALYAHPDPVGPRNDLVLKDSFTTCQCVIAAWGAHGAYKDRALRVCELAGLDGVRCLGTTSDGHPRHPLYVRADTPLELWSPPFALWHLDADDRP